MADAKRGASVPWFPLLLIFSILCWAAERQPLRFWVILILITLFRVLYTLMRSEEFDFSFGHEGPRD